MRVLNVGKKAGCLLIILLLFFANQSPILAKAASKESAQSAILIDLSTGRPLYEKNAHQKLKIASITKVMTAVIAIESGKLNKQVKVSRLASHTEGSSLYLKEGETIPLKELVIGLMLRSGNDAAVAIAEGVGGSIQGFTQMMNAKCKELGMTDTHFENPHGLDAPTHYSTAYDMAILTKYAMTLPVFKKIAGTTTYHAKKDSDSIDRYWRNKNKLLFSYPYITGGKTGYTTGARRTLITTAEKDGKQLAVVTLNDGNDWHDHRNLYEWGFRTFKMRTLVTKGELNQSAIPELNEPVFVHRTVRILLSKKEFGKVQTQLFIKSPKRFHAFSAHNIAGYLTFKLENKQLAKVPVYKGASADKHSGFWETAKNIIRRLTSIGESGD